MSDQGQSGGERCSNCAAVLGGEWCAACGQRRARRLDLMRVLADAGRHILELDGPLWSTLRDLSIAPGHAARRYIEGGRRRLINPLKYLFWVSTGLVLLPHLIGQDPAAQFQAVQDLETLPEGTAEGLTVFLSLQPYVVFLVLLPVGLLQELIFPKRYNMAECYVFQAYVNAHLSWLQGLQLLLLEAGWGGPFMVLSFFALFALYQLWATVQLYGGGWSVWLRGLLLLGSGLVISTFFINAGLVLVMRHLTGSL